MIRTYLRIAWRKLSKNKLYTAVNLVGLTLGLTSCLLIGLYILNETGYDQFQQKADRIVRVTMEYGEPGNTQATAVTGTKAGPQLARTFPQVESYTRMINSGPVVKLNDEVFKEKRFLYADSSFLSMFSFHLVAGNPATALDAPNKVLLSASTAKKYFGTTDPIGKTLNVENTKEYTITGVLEDAPENSQVKYNFVASFSSLGASKTEEWWSANYLTYLLLRKPARVADLQGQVNRYMNTVSKQDLKMGLGALNYQLQPMKDVHLHSTLSGLEPNGDSKTIYIISIISLLILVIACINYTNLSTVQSSARGAEIGIRKVLGARPAQLFGQFIGESMLMTLFSLVLAFCVAAMLMPFFNDLTGKHLSLHLLFHPLPIILALLFCILIGFASGSYPALILSNAKLINTLKSGIRLTSSGGIFRKSLIVFQFAVSICLIVCTMVIVRQLDYLNSKDLGYNKEHVIVMPLSWQMHDVYPLLRDAVAQGPNVLSVTGGNASPSFAVWGDGLSTSQKEGEGKDVSVTALPSDLGYIKTMDMKIVAGQDFMKSDFALMDTSENGKNFQYAFILNEKAIAAFGWKPEEAIGKTIYKGGTPGVIRGVLKDFNFASLHEPIGPLMLFLDQDNTNNLFVKTSGQNLAATIAFLGKTWKERVPDRPFEYKFLDEDYARLYSSENTTAKIFTTFATMAILLACLGLFGLAAFATLQRVKEIGIRKVLGSSVSAIILLLSGEFMKLTLIAIVVASPIAWFFMDRWLKDFAYRTSIQWWIFVLAGAAALLIAFVTVGLQSVRAALANPVKSLKGDG